MMRAASLRFLTLLGVLGAGCTTAPPVEPPPAPLPPIESPAPKPAVQTLPPPLPQEIVILDPAAEELKAILMYFTLISRLSANDVRREYDTARAAFAANPSEANRLRLALVLSLATNPSKDERRAMDLLEPMTKDLRGNYTPLRGLALVTHTLIREQQKLGTSVQALKEKLDALMSLEKSLTERTRPEPGVKR
jgi:hypothetical protein